MSIKKNYITSYCDHEFYKLSELEYSQIEKEKDNYEDARAAVIEALKIVQKNHRWVCDEAITTIAKVIGINETDVEEVATFYSQIYRTPVGRHVIKYCDSVVCYIRGYVNIQIALEKKLKIKTGETTSDGRFTLLPICCLGNCDKGPTMMVNEDTHVNLTIESISNILELYK